MQAQQKLQALIDDLVEVDEHGYFVCDRVLRKGGTTAFFAGMRLAVVARELGIPTNVSRDELVRGIRLDNSGVESADVVDLEDFR